MKFNKNKNVFVHRWYPFVEGYSNEFIDSILNELPYTPKCALEPFAGSGTTPLQLQNSGISCYSFEVSPFMYLLTKVKLKNDYEIDIYEDYKESIFNLLNQPLENIRLIEPIPFGKTIIERYGLKKWNFNDEVLDALLNIRHAIKTIPQQDYRNLFLIALASIIMQVSNLFRNGKCLSYKKKWNEKHMPYKEVVDLFKEKLDTIFQQDIESISKKKSDNNISNLNLCMLGDVRDNIKVIPDNSIDLIITSPPYLNSRDYTDIYILELKILELINSYEELYELRKKTIRSHVQVRYDKNLSFSNERLKHCINKIISKNPSMWNNDIIQMINSYFIDMDGLFKEFQKKIIHNGNSRIYFNVANSAYCSVEVPVDEIICDIAEDHGFSICEIRKARDLKPSPQQALSVGKLRESVIVITI